MIGTALIQKNFTRHNRRALCFFLLGVFTAVTATAAPEKVVEHKMADETIKKMQSTYGKTWKMMPYEVTYDDWKPCYKAKACLGARIDDSGFGRGKRPVINVSYDEAVAFAAWLSKSTGKHYRLPTEDEWEYAARAGTTTDYWWGNEVGSNNANCNGCGSKWDGKETAPVGSFKPNAFGLYDTAGNVWEWTSTCLDACTTRIVRGGSWAYKPAFLRVFVRSWDVISLRYNNVGFRLVEDL